MRKAVVKTIDSFLDENDALLIEWHSKQSKKNKWIINGEKQNVSDIKRMLNSYAIEKEYTDHITLRSYKFVKDLVKQFTHKTYCNRNEKLMLKVAN